MSECMRIKGVVISDDFKPGYTTIIRLRCKMWSCPHCGPINAQSWRAYLLDRFNKALREEKWIFCTITAHRNAHRAGPIATLLNLQRAWKKLYDALGRRYGRGFQYVRVFEQHLSGRYHMHFLLNAGAQYDAHDFLIKDTLDEYRHPECKWLRRAVSRLGAGWRCHIRRVWEARTRTANVGLVVGYMIKYMGKNMAIMEFPKYQRRIATSSKIGSPKRAAAGQGSWEHAREYSLEKFLSSKKPVLDFSTGEILQANSFEGESYYPPLRYYRGEGWNAEDESAE